MEVYVLECSELLDNGNTMPVLYGVYSTREKANEQGKALCRETDYLIDYEVTMCMLDEVNCAWS